MTLSESINIQSALNITDWIFFSVVLILTFGSIVYGQTVQKNNQREKTKILDHLIMGRQLTLPFFIATLVATWYGGIFGVTQIAFDQGIYNLITQGFFWYITYIIFALFLVKRVAKYKAVTLPDLIGKMFGPNSATLAGYFNFFNVLPIAYTISIGLLIQALFGYSLLMSSLIGTSIVCVYSIFGGFRAVVFSDFVQFFFMCLGVLLVIIFSYLEFGGISFLTQQLPPRYFSFTGDQSLLTTFSWGLIALATLVDPNFYQRCFAALSDKVAKKGILISTIIWLCFDLCTTFGAMYAKATIPSALSETAYLTYSLQILPHGFRGLFIAGIFATILSTLDSYLFLAGTTLTYDLFPKFSKNKLRFHHFGIILVGAISLSLSLLFEGNIKNVWKILGSYSSACLLLPVVYGHFYPSRLKDKQFITLCLFSALTVTFWEVCSNWKLINLYPIDSIYVGAFSSLTLLVFFHNVSKK